MNELSLFTLPGYKEISGPVVTVIMDGVGMGPLNESNGVHVAYTPVLDQLMQGDMFMQLKAHGIAVGCPATVTWEILR
jgi:2,3-bisphosphoglycerate-independent phosphoglycerate mutase